MMHINQLYYAILFSILCSLSISPVYSQKYHYKVYSVDNGLPQSEIWSNSMVQDSRGSIWVGTNGGGVVRFDGDSKTIFSKKDGLPSNGIRCLYIDSQENLWVATMEGIAKFNGYEFTTYLDTGKTLTNINILGGTPQISEDKFKNIWFKTATNLYLLQDSLFVNYGSGVPDFQGSAFISTFLDKDGALWLTTNNNGVWTFDGEKFIPAPIIHSEVSEGLNLVFGLYDQDYNTWYIALDPNTRTPQLLMNNDDYWVNFKLPANCNPRFITDIMVDQNENIWISNFSTGVYKYDGERFWEFNTQNGMPSNAVSCLLEDYEGNIWAATRGGGLVKIPSTGFTNFSQSDGLIDPIIFTLYEDSKQNVWIGSTNGNVYKFDGEKIVSPPNIPSANLNRIDAFYEEPSGKMLIGARLGGLFRYDGKGLTPVNQEFGIPPRMACSTIIDRGDTFVFGTFGGGVFIWDKQSKKVIKNINTSNGLNNNLVQDIAIDSKGNFWIATLAGMSFYDGQTCKEIFNAEGKPMGICLQLYIDKKDNAWVVSYDRGLYRMQQGNETKLFDLNEGQEAPNLFYSLTGDNKGSIWIGTQRGIDRIDLDEKSNIGQITNFGASDGLNGIEMNGSAAMKDSKGNLWFGHLNGVSYYTPSEKKFNDTPPVSAITGLELFYDKVNWQNDTFKPYHDGISRWYNLPQNLVLPYDQNHLTFKYSSLSYTLPEKVKRQYMMEPLNDEWLPVSTKQEATFSSLSPGSYTFKVRTQNNDGVFGPPVSFSFNIRPPFWLTWWFWLLSILIIISSIVMAVRMRVKRLKEHKANLERLVKERTAELINRNEEITMQNAALEQQKEEILTQAEEIDTQNKALSNANNEILEQHKNITSSITYAKRIQDAMLPQTSKIKAHIPESFVLYKPRDIVSGDFYWFDEKIDHEGNKKLVFAAADCTGHGVPGAFMSMVGDAYLNIAVRNKNILSPNLILDELNVNIITALKQGVTENRDGMDIALAVIDKEKRTIDFSGARNPLIYIHNGELKQFKGDKKSIGGDLSQHQFTKHTLQYEPGTTFYMFSDGYVDQFGGPENRKYLIRNFRELLLDIHQFSLDKQFKILSDNIEGWKGEYRQIDDILVIGFRL